MSVLSEPESDPASQKPSSQLSSPPDHVDFRWVGRGADLAALCERWRRNPAIALDTEFVRERTYYPALGLVQLATEDEIALLDPKSIDDPAPLLDLLRDPQVTKVLHACSEDLETFRHTWDLVPEPLVDTQIAAAMAGLDWSMGYGRLVAEVCAVDLPKGHTRTNWLKRPLSDAQKRYAALDVLYLLPVWRSLERRLEDLGRLDWLREDCAGLIDTALADLDPEDAYLQIGRAKVLDPRRLAILRSIARWREEQARVRDLPRNFVLREQAVAEIAQRPPSNLRQLRKVKGIGPKEVRRDGEEILRRVEAARSLEPSDLPGRIGPPLNLAPYSEAVKLLRRKLSEVSDDLDVPQVLLSNRRTVEELLRRHLENEEPVLPAPLRGWRADVVGNPLLQALKAQSL